MTDRSPKILRTLWGDMQVEGLGHSRDVKLYPGGGRDWDWTETGTAHYPGIQPADVQELLDHGAQVIVFGLGVLGRLRMRAETMSLLDERGITFHVAATPEAVDLYNRLTDTEAVGGLFHSTC